MRHRNKGFKLGRTHAHRAATLAALSTALIQHKRIRTTLTKAKALRMYVEPLITRSKEDSTHNRREVFRHLQNKYAVTALFTEISDKVGERAGGYTRVIKLGPRNGDGTEMAVIELVDYNDVRPDGAAGGSKKRTRRAGGRRGGGRKADAAAPAATAQSTQKIQSTQANPAAGPTESVAVDAPVADEVAVPVPERSEPNEELKAAAEEAVAARDAEGSDEPAAQDEATEEETDDEKKS